MKTKDINKEKVILAVSKMVANKVSVSEYLKGNISLETLHKKGIKFAKPV